MPHDFTRPASGYEYSCLTITEPRPGVKVLTLNRPESLNALSFKKVEDLETALQR